ncbi:MAG TPA: ABC transporter ATP-binding protein [Polyangiales bacterium]|nr:ABC transporter ATP-binding protein [Polyangiales bacterium]
MIARGLTLRIESRIGALQIDVELETGPGPLVIIGPNGAGKTSLLSSILGVSPVERGRIEVAGAVLVDTAAGIDVPLEHRRLGYVPQDYALFPHLTVRENVEFALASSAAIERQERAQRVAAVLRDLAISELAERRTRGLSGGEKQRVALARALCVRPQALLLDEPLAALDVHARREVREFLSRYLRELGLPTLVVTHDAADAQQLGSRIAVLEAGRITQRGTWADLAQNPGSKFVEEFIATAGR